MSLCAVRCTQCATPLAPEHLNHDTFVRCPMCRSELLARAFPALLDGVPAIPPGQGLAEGQAACFYHAGKKAVIACDHCGRFLCRLCHIPTGRRHLCPACLDALTRQTGEGTLVAQASRYDNVALVLAVVPALVTPLLALYVAIRYWRRGSLLRGPVSAARVTAIVSSLAQLALWAWWLTVWSR